MGRLRARGLDSAAMNAAPRRLIRAALCVAILSGASISFAQLTYTNLWAWEEGTSAVGFLGEPILDNGSPAPWLYPSTWGQTFTADAENRFMNSFTFYFDKNYDSSDRHFGESRFAGYVAAWDDDPDRSHGQVVGPLLYSSGMQTVPAEPIPQEVYTFPAFTFNTGSLELEPGGKYVAFMSAANFFDGVADSGWVGITETNTYDGGSLVTWSGSGLHNLTKSNWADYSDPATNSFLTNTDLAFTMVFSPTAGGAVPEPSTYGMIGAAALLLIAGARRIAALRRQAPVCDSALK